MPCQVQPIPTHICHTYSFSKLISKSLGFIEYTICLPNYYRWSFCQKLLSCLPDNSFFPTYCLTAKPVSHFIDFCCCCYSCLLSLFKCLYQSKCVRLYSSTKFPGLETTKTYLLFTFYIPWVIGVIVYIVVTWEFKCGSLHYFEYHWAPWQTDGNFIGFCPAKPNVSSITFYWSKHVTWPHLT